jgi:hypothetical protein
MVTITDRKTGEVLDLAAIKDVTVVIDGVEIKSPIKDLLGSE